MVSAQVPELDLVIPKQVRVVEPHAELLVKVSEPHKSQDRGRRAQHSHLGRNGDFPCQSQGSRCDPPKSPAVARDDGVQAISGRLCPFHILVGIPAAKYEILICQYPVLVSFRDGDYLRVEQLNDFGIHRPVNMLYREVPVVVECIQRPFENVGLIVVLLAFFIDLINLAAQYGVVLCGLTG